MQGFPGLIAPASLKDLGDPGENLPPVGFSGVNRPGLIEGSLGPHRCRTTPKVFRG